MRIGIDLIELDPVFSGGVKTFSLGLAAGLARVVREPDSVVILVASKNEEYLRSVFAGANVSFMRIAATKRRWYIMAALRILSWAFRCFKILYWYDLIFKSGASKEIEDEVDILLTPMTTLRFFALSIPTVVCMHDIQHEYYPEFFSLKDRISRWATYRISCWAATRIQVSSTFIKNCILQKFPSTDPNKIFVVYEGVDFEKFYCGPDSVQPNGIELVPGEKFVYYPAQIWKHKNHLMLVEALFHFRRLVGHEMPCILTGADYGHWGDVHEMIAKYDLQRIRYLGRVDFETVIWLYKKCSAVLALGLHESSSLPVREGAVFGKPLICSCIPPNVETSKYLILQLVSSNNPMELVSNLISIDDDRNSFGDYKSNVERVKMFDWDLLAVEYLAEFEKCASN